MAVEAPTGAAGATHRLGHLAGGPADQRRTLITLVFLVAVFSA